MSIEVNTANPVEIPAGAPRARMSTDAAIMLMVCLVAVVGLVGLLTMAG
jgi:hypothetical protein